MEKQLASLAVEYWKLLEYCRKALILIDEDRARRFQSQLRFSDIQLRTILAEVKIKLIAFDGQKFDLGLAASAENVSDFDEDEDLIITKTLAPAVVREMKVLSKGKVLVSKNKEE